jgi:poly-gamma-glutamate synthesis protein (capsule biosynthesis protein)
MRRLIAFILIICLTIFVPTPAQKTAASEPGEVTLVMVGDILLHTPVEEAARNDDGTYNFDAVFSHTAADIRQADLAIVNQEVIIGGKDLGISGYPAFNAPAEIGDALVKAGFDVVCHATNHALDKGKRGIRNTLDYWNSTHPEVAVVGINGSQQQRDTVDIITRDGIRIAVLNYTYGTNGIPAPKDMPFAVDMLDETKVKSDLEYAEKNADFTIVCPHWGTEYNTGIDRSQKKWTEIFRAGGADLVLGTHPHVIEPIEYMEDDVPGHGNNHGGGDMLVYYSLGNFVNWTSGTGRGVMNRMVGGMAQVTLEKRASGEVVVSDYGVKALVCHVNPGYNGVTVFPLGGYTDELAASNSIKNQDSSFSRQQCLELCNRIWGSSWR